MKTFSILLTVIFLLLIGCKSQSESKSRLDYREIDRSQFSNNPGICEDTCFGDFDELGQKKIGNILNIYISGHNVDLASDCCQFTFAEIISNFESNDTTIQIVKTHLIDIKKFAIPTDMSEYGTDEIKRKVMVVCTKNLKGEKKIIVDPYKFGIYNKPKNWELK